MEVADELGKVLYCRSKLLDVFLFKVAFSHNQVVETWQVAF